ncbi:unnamed protein product [Schistosoma rodhaini]|uniref:UPF0506 domain-containing protein n=1 Tax=Schistosoma rodhaini TaxID=6188 RepID=A0AA85GGP7_9TREM|nr:unnamed protein product [Schistosoma rodhaini]CAH8638985.1 unnamed protein product [Schistosoma rodhaini]
MNQFYYAILMVMIVTFSYFNVVSGDCRTVGQECSKTVFSSCCDSLYCGLNTLFSGQCQLCLAGGYFCWTDKECCSGKCSWLKCTDPIKDVVERLTG